MSANNKPNAAARLAHDRRSEGQKQRDSYGRSMSRRKHANDREVRALVESMDAMFWERRVR